MIKSTEMAYPPNVLQPNLPSGSSSTNFESSVKSEFADDYGDSSSFSSFIVEFPLAQYNSVSWTKYCHPKLLVHDLHSRPRSKPLVHGQVVRLIQINVYKRVPTFHFFFFPRAKETGTLVGSTMMLVTCCLDLLLNCFLFALYLVIRSSNPENYQLIPQTLKP